MKTLFVDIPVKADYTLYAEGILLSKEKLSDCFRLEFEKRNCLILYYTMKKYRRLYIVSSPELFNNKFKFSFEDVSEPVSVIAQLRARSFDRFKQTISYLRKTTDDDVLRLPVQFFWQAATLCSLNKNSKFNIDNLVKLYDAKYTARKIKWKH